jgi:carbon monoxide dehydrogenase subunit G
MSFTINETFRVHAPADRVWRYLIDPGQVAECLPGAELTSAIDARTFEGRVRVKIGPVTAAYEGRVELLEVDERARTVRVLGEGSEAVGSGAARMTMTSTVIDCAVGVCEVRVDAQIEIAGKAVQFGRGMIERVSQQMFQQFTECVRTRLEYEAAATAPAGAAAPTAPGHGPGAFTPGAAPIEAPDAWMSTDASVVDRQSLHGGTPTAEWRARQGPPVRLLPLLWRALRDLVLGWFRPAPR